MLCQSNSIDLPSVLQANSSAGITYVIFNHEFSLLHQFHRFKKLPCSPCTYRGSSTSKFAFLGKQRCVDFTSNSWTNSQDFTLAAVRKYFLIPICWQNMENYLISSLSNHFGDTGIMQKKNVCQNCWHYVIQKWRINNSPIRYQIGLFRSSNRRASNLLHLKV